MSGNEPLFATVMDAPLRGVTVTSFVVVNVAPFTLVIVSVTEVFVLIPVGTVHFVPDTDPSDTCTVYCADFPLLSPPT